MRRLLLALILGLPSLAFAAEPKASIKGPTTAIVGQEVVFDLSGSASDANFPLTVKAAGGGEFKPSLEHGFTADGKPWKAIFVAPRPGNYTVVVIAIGQVDGSDKPVDDVAIWPISIESIAPAPKPDPEPDPGPNPPAPVPPGPSPVTGKLWGTLILPALPTAAEASLRTDPDIRKAFANTSTIYRSYLASESELEKPGYKQALDAAGGPPAVIWVTESGKVVGTTKAATEEKILADLKMLRGSN